MFISVKRHEREKQDLIGASSRLTDALLKSSAQGLFLLDGKDKILAEVSASLATLFRRQDFTNLSIEKLIGPLVSAKTLSVIRAFVTRLLDAPSLSNSGQSNPLQDNPLQDVEVRLANTDGTFETAHYSFEFHALDPSREPRTWLVRVTDITARVQQQRDLEDLRTQVQTQGEILRSVLQAGGARLKPLPQRTAASINANNAVF